MTVTKNLIESEEFKRCVAFHGHICPGLSIGFRASRVALAWLKARRAEDEENVAIVETDACSADAVQVLTGCTFGKGNFIYLDYGKMALTLLSRATGRGVRVVMKRDALMTNEEHQGLRPKVMRGDATMEERKRFEELHLERSREVLEAPEDRLFTITPVTMELPPKARMEPSELCVRCGEPTMASKLVQDGEGKVCRGCLRAGQKDVSGASV